LLWLLKYQGTKKPETAYKNTLYLKGIFAIRAISGFLKIKHMLQKYVRKFNNLIIDFVIIKHGG
jgi:hypothetical protein